MIRHENRDSKQGTDALLYGKASTMRDFARSLYARERIQDRGRSSAQADDEASMDGHDSIRPVRIDAKHIPAVGTLVDGGHDGISHTGETPAKVSFPDPAEREAPTNAPSRSISTATGSGVRPLKLRATEAQDGEGGGAAGAEMPEEAPTSSPTPPTPEEIVVAPVTDILPGRPSKTDEEKDLARELEESPQNSAPTDAISTAPHAEASPVAASVNADKTPADGTAPTPPVAKPEIRAVKPIGLRPIEIKKASRALKEGRLRPSFYVPQSVHSCKTFQEAIHFSRQLLPLPREMQLNQKPAHRTWLIAQLQRCENHRQLSDFAFSLNYRDLATVFPTLATLTSGGDIDKIISIIMMRASKYLYLQGWITLQYAYPRSTVQKGLSELCEILENSRHPADVFHGEEDQSWFHSLHLGPERFDWKSIRLISEINMPNTRHFLASMIKYLRESGISGDEFFRRYGIYRDLPLGQAIHSQWEMAMFENRVQGLFSTRKLFNSP